MAGMFAPDKCGDFSVWLCVFAGMFLPRSAHFWGAALVMGIINNLLPFFLIAWGQLFVTGGMASIINANTAFFGVIISAIFLRSEPLKLHRVIGVFLGILGVATVIGFDAATGASASIIGSLAILLATLSYALAGVWGKLKLGNWPAIQVACGMLICSASLSIPASFLISGMPSFSLFQPANLLVLDATGYWYWYFGNGAGLSALFRILSLAGASNLMLVTIIVPVFAVALDAAILGQWIGVASWLGFCWLLSGWRLWMAGYGQNS